MLTSTASIEALYNLIASRTGLVLSSHQFSDISRILDELATSAGVTQPDDLLAFLLVQPETHPLWQRIVHTITVGETYFFRNKPQFDALRSHVLPGLIDARRQSGNKHLRLWSAGSATGEEPYSLAILLRELLPDIETWSISILATDINEEYLAQARRGIFRPRSFRSEISGWAARGLVHRRAGRRAPEARRAQHGDLQVAQPRLGRVPGDG